MTEKSYGGASPHSIKSMPTGNAPKIQVALKDKNSKRSSIESSLNLTKEELDNLKKAGNIASQVIAYAKSFIKAGMPLIEIAEKIEAKVIELGGKPAFPVNLSIDIIAAHSTPLWNDTQIASGLLKVDSGVHVDGFVADTSFSIDLDNSEENKILIKASQEALKNAINAIKEKKTNIKIREIGREIESAIQKYNLQPIQNLCGHSIQKYELHAGVTLPNYDNAQERKLESGVYAIEPFATNGLGSVRDGKKSSIYAISKEGNVRDPFAREILQYIMTEYKKLPFCTRWLVKKFGTRAVIAMQRIEEAGLVHHYAQLVESGNGKIAQSEHTIILTESEVIVTTE